MGKPLQIDEVWLKRIISNLEGMEYGSVSITVHDGRIMQIERTERKRFEQDTASVPQRTARR
ncbi:YezD family protein [Paenibacillus gansuensis]|uniref:YezD family protein n=1 Tax=Paenibacillus gansuensis TaxID=306542 RepID=A0ABW5PC75_9BACL